MLTEQLQKILELIKALVENFTKKDEAFAMCKRELVALRQVDTQTRAANKHLESEVKAAEAEIKALEEEQEEAMKLIDDITKYLQKQ